MIIIRGTGPRLIFANVRDAALACEAFNEALAAGENVGLVSDERAGVLATKYLRW